MLGNISWGRLSFAVLLVGMAGAPLVTTAAETAPVGAQAECAAPGHGAYGTSVRLYDDVSVAAKLADEESKLLFVAQLSGNFQKETFT